MPTPPTMSMIDARSGRLARSVALVGLMGAGKSTVGRRLASALHAAFYDSDDEIERAAGMSVADIFEAYGEAHFRDGERRVIERLLSGGPCVLATGGGAFMDAANRARLLERSFVVWLRADLDTLDARCGRRDDRPLLRGANRREVLSRLIDERYPVYSEAHFTVDSGDGPHDAVVQDVLSALRGCGLAG